MLKRILLQKIFSCNFIQMYIKVKETILINILLKYFADIKIKRYICVLDINKLFKI